VKILVDENIPGTRIEHLRRMGHDVVDIRGTAEEGLSDEDLWKKAQHNQYLLITTGRGFARRRHQRHPGILIVLLRQPNRRRITQRVMEAMQSFSAEEWPHLLVIMRDTVMSTWRASV
jgi:predicted nuclease of predicted toxin-antitoxin system